MFALGCFWGRGANVLADARLLDDGVGIRRRPDTEPNLRSSLLGPHPTQPKSCASKKVSYSDLLWIFFENHDPTRGHAPQRNDVGTQYSSAIYATSDTQERTAEKAPGANAQKLRAAGYGRLLPKSATRRNSTIPKTITNSIWSRTGQSSRHRRNRRELPPWASTPLNLSKCSARHVSFRSDSTDGQHGARLSHR